MRRSLLEILSRRKLRGGALMALAAGGFALLPACATVHVDPIEVKPITLNVNINYVDQQLDDFFAYQKANPTTAPGAGITAPAAPAAPAAGMTPPAAPMTAPANPGTMP
jgi:hypothetical protein